VPVVRLALAVFELPPVRPVELTPLRSDHGCQNASRAMTKIAATSAAIMPPPIPLRLPVPVTDEFPMSSLIWISFARPLRGTESQTSNKIDVARFLGRTAEAMQM
jgi:hypothetical protein